MGLNKNTGILLIELLILTIAFSAEVIISITKNPEAWVADYPPEIQAEYYKTHENKREKLTKGTIVRKGVAIIVALFLFARIKRWRLPGTEHMDKEYHQKWFHVKVELKVLPLAVVFAVLCGLVQIWLF